MGFNAVPFLVLDGPALYSQVKDLVVGIFVNKIVFDQARWTLVFAFRSFNSC